MKFQNLFSEGREPLGKGGEVSQFKNTLKGFKQILVYFWLETEMQVNSFSKQFRIQLGSPND